MCETGGGGGGGGTVPPTIYYIASVRNRAGLGQNSGRFRPKTLFFFFFFLLVNHV